MTEDITQRVIRVIAANQRIQPETITEDSTFLQLNIDSLDGLHILFEVEEEFGVDVPDDAARGFTSVRQVIDGVSTLLAQKEAALKEAARETA
jgi:acyl carrier protein